DAREHTGTDNRHQHQRPDQRIDRARRYDDEQGDRPHHTDAWRGVARGAVGYRDGEYHGDERADGGDIEGVPDRPTEHANVKPVGGHHTHGKVAGLLRCVPDEGPDGLVGNELETADEQGNGEQPGRPDQQLGATVAPPPGPRPCCDRGHYCTQRRKNPEPYSHSMTIAMITMMMAAAESNS